MIEFNGYISGRTEKYFWKRNAVFGQNILLISMVVCSPIAFIMSSILGNNYFIVFYLIMMLVIPLLCRIPKRKKEKIKYNPYRICIEDGYITCYTKIQEESRNLEDVKRVEDHGEWYYLVFPVGKTSTSFVCQKDLLVKGTIEEFEKLFENKIVCKVK